MAQRLRPPARQVRSWIPRAVLGLVLGVVAAQLVVSMVSMTTLRLGAGDVLRGDSAAVQEKQAPEPQPQVSTTLPPSPDEAMVYAPVTFQCDAEGSANQKREQLVGEEDENQFRRFLEEYSKLHADILSGRRKGKILRLMCPPTRKYCEGWGDRLKGFHNIAMMAMLTNSAFVIGDANRLAEDVLASHLYSGENSPRWATPVPENATHVIHCHGILNCECPRVLHTNPEKYDDARVIDVYSNIDCIYSIASASEEFLEKTRINKIPMYRTILMERFFPATPQLKALVRNTVPQIPDVGIHIRSGWMTNDAARYQGKILPLITSHMQCLAPLTCEPPKSVFLAIDNERILEYAKFTLDKMGIKYFTSEGAGNLMHISRDNADGSSAKRMILDFEILRQVPVLLASPSGFSLMAHRVRYNPLSVAFISIDSCKRLPTSLNGWYFNVGNW